MRILASNHDYYDVVQSQGQDQSLLYLRKREEVEVNFPFPVFRTMRNWKKPAPIVDEYVVGFCGRIYPALHLSTDHLGHTGHAVCFTLEEVDSFVERNFREKQIRDYKSKFRDRWRIQQWDAYYTQGSFKKFFEKFEEKKDAFQKLFEEKHCPVFVATYHGWNGVSSGTIVWNDSLREHEFYRLFDPYQAFQEISMWLGAQAVPLRPIPEVSDRDLLQAKGFDKFSFRKPKKTRK